MKSDTYLQDTLGVFRDSPCVFSTWPVPPQAPRPYIYCGGIVADAENGTKTEEIRDHMRDVVIVDDASGDESRIDALGEYVRALFNRKPLTISGYANMIAKARGPMKHEVDPTLYGRRLELDLILVATS